MLKNLLYFFTLGLFAFGCLDGNETDPAPLGDCQISTTADGGTGYPFTLKYSFNDQNQLTRITATDTSGLDVRLTYDTKGRLFTEKEGDVVWENEYNTQDQLVKQTRTFSAGGRIEQDFYLHTYNSAGQLQESTFHSANEPSFTQYRYVYHYTNNMITHVEKTTYAANGFVEDITITYDGKKQPLPLLPMIDFHLHFGDPHPAFGLSAGNVTSYKVVNREDGSISPVSYTASYTYNEQGYPTEAVRVYADGTVKRRYTYNCP
ncbi:hypothetical protein [Sabulibacter ruber]|uniref:hypothetical protein n=1 Tax=Sabulibacter ruber TaxID=2811901 RepID=UPI001A965230|nr:hypothetical protein [Sabulibacter ruber]